MSRDRQRAAATLTTGAGLSFAGGVLRHKGVRQANKGVIPNWKVTKPIETLPARALVRRGAMGRGKYATGAVLGLVGAPAIAVGGHDLVTRKVRKADEPRKRVKQFVREGLEGTADAASQKIASTTETPPKAKIVPVGIALGAGTVGSLGAHRALDRSKAFRGARHATRAGLAATAGTAAAAASFPLARHAMRNSREYEVTPAGVRRRRFVAKKPSSKGQYFDGKTMDRRRFREATVGKVHDPHELGPTTAKGTPRKVHWKAYERESAICGTDGAFGKGHGPYAESMQELTCDACRRKIGVSKADYLGRRTSERKQRTTIYAVGATPVVGPYAAAHQASRYAPPGERRSAGVKQFGGIVGGGLAGGAAGGLGLAMAAERHSGVARGAQKATELHGRASARINSLRPVAAVRSKLPKGSGRMGRHGERALRAVGPVNRNRAAALAGAWAGSKIGAFAGGTAAQTSNLKAQRRYNLKHPVTKSMTTTAPMPDKERRKLARKKRAAAASSTFTGITGLGALGAMAAKRPQWQTGLLTAGAAVGGANSLNFAGVLRREAKADDPTKIKKGMTLHFPWRSGGTVCGKLNPTATTSKWSQVTCASCHRNKHLVAKADRREPLTRMRSDQAARIVRQYGDAGPLPNHLGRSERMTAYEARYVHAGGRKAEHWQRRADRADKVKVGGLAGATAGGAAYLALRHPGVAARMGSKGQKVRHAADTATIGAATVSGAGELYASHARRKRSSYSNAKAGVAASALRRMKDYSS